MTETSTPAPPTGSTAGAILRTAREQQGLHLAVLAAAIKISTRKLDALEGDRYDELPDPAFTRALAQTVARALKLDPQPVLALLPPAVSKSNLDSVGEGLNTPFKDRTSPTELSALLPRAPLVWAGLALLAAAALLLYWPYRQAGPATTVSTPAQEALPLPNRERGVTGPSVPGGVAETAAASPGPALVARSGPTLVSPPSQAASMPTIDPTTSVPGAAAAATAGTNGASVSVTEPVWLEVVDGTGSVVFMRTIQPGEVVNFEEKLPIRLKLGNAQAAKVTFRGEAVDLVPLTRGSVARVVLK